MRLIITILAMTVVAVMSFAPSATNAQSAGKIIEDIQLTSQIKSDIIDSVATALDENYVFPDVATEIEKVLRGKLESGKFDDISLFSEFTSILTEDIQSVNGDLHLWIRPLDPETYAGALVENVEENKERSRRRDATRRRKNYGFQKMEILSGNVGYLDLRSFAHTSMGGPTAVGAMNYLSNSDALIFDLRQNGGGNATMIELITSYLFEYETHLNSQFAGRSSAVRQVWSRSDIDGQKMDEIPVYVLTSASTFSAAEAFAYSLQSLDRATIVGETTGGGAHTVGQSYFKVTDEVMIRLQLPMGRAVNPITKTNWEGVGVIPDISVPADQALDVALLEAAKKLAEDATDEDQLYGLEWTIRGLEAKNNPIALKKGIEDDLVGTFGPRVITFEDGKLYYQREGWSKFELLPLGDNIFDIMGLDYFRIEFVRESNGKANKLIGLYQEGNTDSNDRTND